MTYDEIRYTTAIVCDIVAKLMDEPSVSKEEKECLNGSLRKLKAFATLHYYNNRVFKED